jgi:predicted transcriptional regulator of viral defense system
MKHERTRANARQFIEALAARGTYTFGSADARSALGATAWKFALSRLARQGLIASPARGFYVIVPPEYRVLGCLPADQFIPALMGRIGARYYAGLLTAAQYHGAAHQRPQEYQVFVEKPRRALVCRRVRVAFIVRKRLREVPVQSLKTPRGALLVSTPEATAIDLVGYQQRAGGLHHVVMVLAELAEKIDATKLVAAATSAPAPWVQRLGYLLERVGAAGKVAPLKEYVRARAHVSAPLLAAAPRSRAARKPKRASAWERNADWRLYINTVVEPPS